MKFSPFLVPLFLHLASCSPVKLASKTADESSTRPATQTLVLANVKAWCLHPSVVVTTFELIRRAANAENRLSFFLASESDRAQQMNFAGFQVSCQFKDPAAMRNLIDHKNLFVDIQSHCGDLADGDYLFGLADLTRTDDVPVRTSSFAVSPTEPIVRITHVNGRLNVEWAKSVAPIVMFDHVGTGQCDIE